MALNDARVAAVIVTHDSGQVLPTCLAALRNQKKILERIVIVDSGSADPAYLDRYRNDPRIDLIYTENIGFSRANNLGAAQVMAGTDYIIFLNPDTFLPKNFVAEALMVMRDFPAAGLLTGKLLSFDPQRGKTTGHLDSTGIFRKWYGRWYDRGHGEEDLGQYQEVQYVPAICGALMFCRSKILRQQAHYGDIFDPCFFMYKEDIELCLRLQQHGVKFLYHPLLRAYHCRGWDKERRQVPYAARLLSARNELLLYRKYPSVYILWALAKYFLVRYFQL